MSTFKSVGEVEQWNGGLQKKSSLEENENAGQFMYQSTKRRKGGKVQTISIGVEKRAESYEKISTEKGVIYTRKKFYSP